MLQAEVTALKTLVITSTPASPNRELHPQLLSPTKAGPRKGHLRHKSTSSALCPAVCPVVGHALTPDKEGKEVDTTLFAEFQAWRESPTLDKTSPFLERVYREDVGPCLDFTMQEYMCPEWPGLRLSSPNPAWGLREPLLHLTVLPGQSRGWALLRVAGELREQGLESICSLSKCVAVSEPMFWEITRLRKEMSLAKLGFFPQEA
ncbi:Guanine nucleotide exchange factor for Rab-3A, partial [Eschrichtius robustus]|nr:Guanine nucleotide exchange factor for Rab-3A [Eschrichtius robustus]